MPGTAIAAAGLDAGVMVKAHGVVGLRLRSTDALAVACDANKHKLTVTASEGPATPEVGDQRPLRRGVGDQLLSRNINSLGYLVADLLVANGGEHFSIGVYIYPPMVPVLPTISPHT
jgi:hypothetical protein